MIISISAPRGGGKDTVGKIIQLLTNCPGVHWLQDVDEKKLNNYFSNDSVVDVCPWKIKKWSTALKQIASILIGIPIEDFEKEAVKNSYLPDCWNKMVCASTTRFLKDSEFYGKDNKVYEKITVRQFLQLLGTEAIRDGLHENTWVNALMSEYKPQYFGPMPTYQNPDIGTQDVDYPNWIITDTRFPNELQAVKDRGGICIRVDRQSVETGDTHESETAWRNWKFDYVVNNDGTIEDLIIEVEKMLKHFNIIDKIIK